LNVGTVGTFAPRLVTVRALAWSGRRTAGLKPSGWLRRTLIGRIVPSLKDGATAWVGGALTAVVGGGTRIAVAILSPGLWSGGDFGLIDDAACVFGGGGAAEMQRRKRSSPAGGMWGETVTGVMTSQCRCPMASSRPRTTDFACFARRMRGSPGTASLWGSGLSCVGILAMSDLPKYRGQPGVMPVYDPDLSHGRNRSATSARVVHSPRALHRQAGDRRGDGCLRIRQKHRRGPARRRAGLPFPGRRRPAPARQCREDAQRDSVDGRGPAALAPPRRSTAGARGANVAC
jgi:hypothetical protein